MHNISFIGGHANFTRRAGSEPAWHILGGETPADAPPEVWAKNSGMLYRLDLTPALYAKADGSIERIPDRKVVVRSDNQTALATVSDRYKVVQPIEVLEFFRDLAYAGGYEMETAGVLSDGARYWALARSIRESGVLAGGDRIGAYLMLATACDGSMATTATHTSIRVVCQNTLSMALSDAGASAIKVRHTSTFDPDRVKRDLQVGDTFARFMTDAERLASTPMADREAGQTIWALLGIKGSDGKPVPMETDQALIPAQTRTKIARVWDLFKGAGEGASLPSARGTAWGLLNAVTQYVDHEQRGHSLQNRVDSSLFGRGAALKVEARDALLKLAA
jgi:phage/plasmid-like protein (TIGR03299 family)